MITLYRVKRTVAFEHDTWGSEDYISYHYTERGAKNSIKQDMRAVRALLAHDGIEASINEKAKEVRALGDFMRFKYTIEEEILED